MRITTVVATLPMAGDGEAAAQNLRQPTGGAPLRPVSPPARLCTATGTPLATWTASGGATVHLLQTAALAVMAVAGDGGEAVALGTLPAAATAAIVVAEGVNLFTPEGIFTVPAAALAEVAGGGAPDVGASLRSAFGDFPAVAITPTAERTHTAYTRALTLTGSYPSWSGALVAADIAAIGEAALTALRSATAAAVADGCAATPLLAWYRLRDAAGAVVGRSIPVVVTPDGVQGPAAVELNVAVAGGSYGAVAAAPVAVRGFKVGLSVDGALLAAAHRRAAVLELMVAPPLDLVDYAAQPYLTRQGHTAEAGTLRVDMPRLARQGAIVPALLDRLDEVSAVAATLSDPFDPDGPLAAGAPMAVDLAVDLDPEKAQTTLLAAIARPSAAAALPAVVRETQLPHTFTAAVACNAADLVALADVTPVHALPLPPAALLIAGGETGAWSAKVRVTLINADGQAELLCAESAGAGALPTALLPVLAYPHPGARRMDVEVTTPGGGTVARTFALTPTPAGVAACYCSPSLRPIALSELAAAEPMRAVSERKPVGHGSTLLIAEASAPLVAVAAAQIGGDSVVAVTEAPHASSGLAFGRRHLYAFTTTAVHAVSVSAGRAIAASPVCRAAIAGGAAVAPGRSGVYCATATGVVRISGTRAVRVHSGRFAALGYSPAYDELWCLTAAGAQRARTVVVDGAGRVATRTDLLPTAFSRTSATLLIATADGLYDASREDADAGAPVAVAWQRRVALTADMVPRLRGLIALMAADSADITIDLLGDNGAAQPHRIAGLALAGNVAAPPYLPVIARPHRYVTVSIAGRVSPDASLSEFQLLMHQSLF